MKDNNESLNSNKVSNGKEVQLNIKMSVNEFFEIKNK